MRLSRVKFKRNLGSSSFARTKEGKDSDISDLTTENSGLAFPARGRHFECWPNIGEEGVRRLEINDFFPFAIYYRRRFPYRSSDSNTFFLRLYFAVTIRIDNSHVTDFSSYKTINLPSRGRY